MLVARLYVFLSQIFLPVLIFKKKLYDEVLEKKEKNQLPRNFEYHIITEIET